MLLLKTVEMEIKSELNAHNMIELDEKTPDLQRGYIALKDLKMQKNWNELFKLQR